MIKAENEILRKEKKGKEEEEEEEKVSTDRVKKENREN